MSFTRPDLPRLRHAVGAYAARLGVVGPRRGALLLAVNEVTDNVIRHAGGRGRLCLYREGRSVRCRVADDGPGFDLARVLGTAPDPARATGWGLWTVRELMDGLGVAPAHAHAPGPDAGRGAVVTLTVTLI
ncbi:ATP-binding protein [Streptomyces sp. NPDC003077]|uniref:ATP-binding protein n=1 Tax=Streptomyces sp. NPDC003077 TaxID=3154443 RepID=UPI0033AA2D70